jgi:dienelactone hydrolase
MLRSLVALFLILAFVTPLAASEIVENRWKYKDGETELEGWLVFDRSTTAKRPGIVILHEAGGIGDHELQTARRLARLGYAAFVADIYGAEMRPGTPEAAAAVATRFLADRPLVAGRVRAAVRALSSQGYVDERFMAVVGFGFGGSAGLEAARDGLDVRSVVAYYARLSPAPGAPPPAVKARLLLFHGSDDPLIPLAEVDAFAREMNAAGADWQLILHGGARHRFANPRADAARDPNTAHNPAADRRSWLAMLEHFKETLGR